MTVYHYSTEAEIIGGNVENAWAIIIYPDEDDEGPRDVDLSELNASDGFDELYADIEEAGTFELDEINYESHLPLRIRYPKNKLIIETCNGERLVDTNFNYQSQEEYDSTHEFIDRGVMAAIQQVDMFHRQPRRIVWRNRDKLAQVE